MHNTKHFLLISTTCVGLRLGLTACGGSGNSTTDPSTANTRTMKRLTDTGVGANQCYAAGSDALVSCASPEAKALSDKQDGMLGLDAGATDNVDGALGFSYSLVPQAAGGTYNLSDCVNDNVTEMVWEGKPVSGTRAANATYTNLGNGAVSDVSGYVAAVNAAKLCGFSDWRLPSTEELISITDLGAVSGPAIDTNWFINTPSQNYWTADVLASDTSKAMAVDFAEGGVDGLSRSTAALVRLIR